MRQAAGFFLVCAMAAGMSASAFAVEPAKAKQQALEEKPLVAEAKITGEVAAASSSGIAVQFGSTSAGAKEIYLPLNEKTKFQRFLNPSQLKAGDTVQVVYEQTYKEPEKGKRILLGAVATEVILLKQAPAQGALVTREGGD
jgi:hypothetical protein